MKFKVEKQDYSRGAWRVLTEEGQQVYRNEIFDHPMLGPIPISGPVCFERKRDAVAWVKAQESTEITHRYCPDSGGEPGESNTTHHLVAVGQSGVQRCRYCKKTSDDLRAEAVQ